MLVLAVCYIGYSGTEKIGDSVTTILEQDDYSAHVENVKTLVLQEWQYYTEYALTHDTDSLDLARDNGRGDFRRGRGPAGDADGGAVPGTEHVHDGHRYSSMTASRWRGSTLPETGDGGNELKSSWDGTSLDMVPSLVLWKRHAVQAMDAATAEAARTKTSATTLTIIVAVRCLCCRGAGHAVRPEHHQRH
jgi:hypothetical protein